MSFLSHTAGIVTMDDVVDALVINATYRQFIQTIFAKSEFSLKFYSEELLYSTVARQTWLEQFPKSQNYYAVRRRKI